MGQLARDESTAFRVQRGTPRNRAGKRRRGQTCRRVLIDDFQQLLVEVGADLDAPDLEGNTPLHYASAWGKISVSSFDARWKESTSTF